MMPGEDRRWGNDTTGSLTHGQISLPLNPSLPPADGWLMTGVRYGLVELNQILGNKYHDTENKAIQ